MLDSRMNMITAIIGFGMSVTFIVFVCTRLIYVRLRRIQARQMFEDSRIHLQLPEQRINGIEPVVIAAIPAMKFNCEMLSSIEDAQCTICLAEYQEKEVLRIMPKCSHSFHLSCIDIWLRKQSTCPVCCLSVQDSDVRLATLSADQSLDDAIVATPLCAEGEGSHQAQSDPISIEVDRGVHAEAAVRLSSL